MLREGYELVDVPSWSPAYDPGTGLWTIPLSTNGMGWFVTAKAGSFSGAGAPDDARCPGRFRSSLIEERDLTNGQLVPLYWRPPTDQFGSFSIEVAFAEAFGRINWYAHVIEVVPVPPVPPAVPPSLLGAPSLPPMGEGATCASLHGVIVVGAGAGGGAAAGYLQAMGVDSLVISDGPDRSNLLGDVPSSDTTYNYFGGFTQRSVTNEAGGAWTQARAAPRPLPPPPPWGARCNTHITAHDHANTHVARTH